MQDGSKRPHLTVKAVSPGASTVAALLFAAGHSPAVPHRWPQLRCRSLRCRCPSASPHCECPVAGRQASLHRLCPAAAHQAEVVGAYVIFEHQESMRRCLEDFAEYRKDWRPNSCTMSKALRLRGTHALTVERAPEPACAVAWGGEVYGGEGREGSTRPIVLTLDFLCPPLRCGVGMGRCLLLYLVLTLLFFRPPLALPPPVRNHLGEPGDRPLPTPRRLRHISRPHVPHVHPLHGVDRRRPRRQGVACEPQCGALPRR